jgi:L-ascorbate metabolism protein UlaG (beta-lactamase superfamily)
MVGHASVIIATNAGGIWCDPWLKGKAFNNSWTLRPPPHFEAQLYDGINYLWISHEHPDHFSVPTLKELDGAFKRRVIVLFQKKNSEKIFDAMRGWGFRNFLALPNRKSVSLSPRTRITCHQVGLLDSILAVTDAGQTVVNLNDADMPQSDLARLRRQVGTPVALLNQFSIAGFDGYLDAGTALGRAASQKLGAMLDAHRILDARFTIPFASFVYFSAVDNRFVNEFANSIGDTQKAFDGAGLKTVVLRPGDEYECGSSWDNRPALDFLQHVFATTAEAEFDTPPRVPLEQLAAAFTAFYANLSRYYPRWLLRRIGAIRFFVQDLGQTIECDFGSGHCRLVGDGCQDADIALYSQPLQFGLVNPFGFETLGVSGRFRVLKNRPRWRMLKIVSMLYNHELYLKPPHIFDVRTLTYVTERLRANLLRQFLFKRQQRSGLT